MDIAPREGLFVGARRCQHTQLVHQRQSIDQHIELVTNSYALVVGEGELTEVVEVEVMVLALQASLLFVLFDRFSQFLEDHCARATLLDELQ